MKRGEVVGEWTGAEGERGGGKWGKKGGKKGARKHTWKTLILVPLWFSYSLVAFQEIYSFFAHLLGVNFCELFRFRLPNPGKCSRRKILVSHYKPIGNTISCNAYSAIGFRGKFFSAMPPPPSKVCRWIAIGHFYGNEWGCSSDSPRYNRKDSATGVLLHLSRDRGGVLRSGR